jgi:type I restriction enzyme, S subunit
MVTFPKYESYRDSEVDWLGEIPSNWGLKKNKFLLKEKKDTVGGKSSNFTLLSLTLQGVIARDMENPQGKFPAEFNTYKIVSPNNLIFCLFDVEETPRTVGHANQYGMITGAYEIFECGDELNSKYLYYYYLSLDFDKRLQSLYSGLRKVIKVDAFLSIKSPIPSIEEQKKIVEFLYCKTAEIDQAIAQKQRLIELLQEQKSILINQAVTKGLNPNVLMKDSGIDWIGKIPEHWQVKQVKHITQKIIDGAHLTPTYVENGVPFLRVTDISAGNKTINLGEVKRIPLKEHIELSKRAKADKGDILLSKNGTIGVTKVVDWDFEFSFFVSLCLIKPKPELVSEYFCLFFDSPLVDEQLNFSSKRTSVTNLHLDKIKELLIALPPPKEQSELVETIEEDFKPQNELINAALREIDLLTEYKKILIAQAVTGKIKI